MMMIYEIPGPPIPCKRPRLSRGRFFDSQAKQKKDLQTFIKTVAAAYLPLDDRLKVLFEYHMPIPKSWSRTRRLNAVKKAHVSRPDLSNLIKFTEDALNEVLWKDDSIIYEIHARKIYSNNPRTCIIIEESSPLIYSSLLKDHLETIS